MSEDSRKTEGAKGSGDAADRGGDAPQRKRRRRRRRRPEGAADGRQGSERPAKTGASKAGESKDGRSRRARGDAESSSDTRRRSRRRSRRPRGDRDSGTEPRPRRSGAPRSDDAERPTRTAEPSARATTASADLSDLAASVGISASELDQGWDDVSEPTESIFQSKRKTTRDHAHPPNREEDHQPEERQRFGDDSDAPAPDIAALPADMPPEVADPDPVTAPYGELAANTQVDEPAPVRNVVGIKYSGPGKIMLCDAGERSLHVGDRVMVESDAGPRLATIAIASLRRPHSSHTGGRLKRVLRRPDQTDLRTVERIESREKNALHQARQTVRASAIPMRIFRAEMAHSGKKVRLYFTAEERVDSRAVTRELSRSLNLRVEMRQTGVRDQARMIGGIGACGQELCCTTWLPEFVPVSIKHAKDQGLVLNPTKVSGQCGRLKCCLVYEQAIYAEMRKGLPKLGKRVITATGEGRVVEVDVLRQRIRVSHVTGDVSVFTKDEVKPMFPSQNQPRGNTKNAKSGERRRRSSKHAAEKAQDGVSEKTSEAARPADAAPGETASAPSPEPATAQTEPATAQTEPAEASSSTEDN